MYLSFSYDRRGCRLGFRGFLAKLEILTALPADPMGGHTLAQSILAAHAPGEDVTPGRIVEASIDLALSHDNTDLIARRFRDAGLSRVWDRDRLVVTLDHRAPAPTAEVADGHARVRAFLREQGVQNFYEVGHGICHQVLPEEGHVHPGMTLVGTDSHTTTHGAFGAFATGIGATEMAAVWATGRLWFRVPETMHVGLYGRLDRWVGAKDLVLHLIGRLGMDGAAYHSVEYHGSLFEHLTVDSRMTLCNLSMELGADVAFTPIDRPVVDWIRERAGRRVEPVHPDPDARYDQEIEVDATAMAPQVACPHDLANVKPVTDIAGTRVDQVFIGTCTNGRLEDLAAAAEILRGEQVSSGIRVLVVPASRRVFLEALDAGIVRDLTESGATFQSAGCGPCLGAHQGLLGAGEVCFSTTNRNFRGRMGHIDSQVYIGSPAVAAATALYGEITDPREV